MIGPMQLTEDQQFFVADKLMDSANVVLGLLVIGQLVANQVKPALLVLGVFVYLWCWSVAVRLKRRKKRKGGDR